MYKFLLRNVSLQTSQLGNKERGENLYLLFYSLEHIHGYLYICDV